MLPSKINQVNGVHEKFLIFDVFRGIISLHITSMARDLIIAQHVEVDVLEMGFNVKR